MPREIRIQHHYPLAGAFVRRHGALALAILHDLLSCAELLDDKLVARASTREIADRLDFLSKDSVHRRLRELVRAGVIEPAGHPANPFAAPSYVIHLAGSGITIDTAENA